MGFLHNVCYIILFLGAHGSVTSEQYSYINHLCCALTYKMYHCVRYEVSSERGAN